MMMMMMIIIIIGGWWLTFLEKAAKPVITFSDGLS